MADKIIKDPLFETKSKAVSIPVNTTPSVGDLYTFDITVNDAKYQIVKGFAITNTGWLAMVQCYFSSPTNIRVRVVNYKGSLATGSNFTVYYI